MAPGKPLRLAVLARYLYRRALRHRAREASREDLKRSAVVFSPHMDDETLGCGGTIIKKRGVGADVDIVFMTDGCQSHNRLIAEDELRSIRAAEAVAASRRLGVAESRVHFLDFRDGELGKHEDAAVFRVAGILERQRPDQVFVPYHREAPPDHSATRKVIVSALRTCGSKVTVYEYPIWFWHQWPWVSVPVTPRRETWALVKDSLVSGLGVRLLKDFRCSVYIGEVLELKRAALSQHKSQMTRLIPDPRWMTLGDVWHGEFLPCFFQDHEIFHRCGLLEKH